MGSGGARGPLGPLPIPGFSGSISGLGKLQGVPTSATAGLSFPLSPKPATGPGRPGLEAQQGQLRLVFGWETTEEVGCALTTLSAATNETEGRPRPNYFFSPNSIGLRNSLPQEATDLDSLKAGGEASSRQRGPSMGIS